MTTNFKSAEERMTTYTNDQLKQALAKMLPEKIRHDSNYLVDSLAGIYSPMLIWLPSGIAQESYVLDTELLHICWLIEQALTEKEDVWFLQRLSQQRYLDGECGTIGTLIDRSVHATWQQRTIALAKVKGITI